jgi:hypothetical protein
MAGKDREERAERKISLRQGRQSVTDKFTLKRCNMRLANSFLVAASFWVLAGAGSSIAQQPVPQPNTQQTAAVGPLSQPLSPRIEKLLTEFRLTPQVILDRNPDGGGALTAMVRDILVGDKTLLEAILALIPKATAAQQEAIGSGLGLVRVLYVRDPDFATAIQTRVVELANKNVLSGYSLFGGAGVAAIGGTTSTAPAQNVVSGPVGTVANGAPASNSQGKAGSSSDGGSTGASPSGISARSTAGSNSVSP